MENMEHIDVLDSASELRSNRISDHEDYSDAVVSDRLSMMDLSSSLQKKTHSTKTRYVIDPVADPVILRTKYNNSNWCHYCYKEMFMHQTSIREFVDSCVDQYRKNSRKFLAGHKAHMLGTLITLDDYTRKELIDSCQDLYNRYERAGRASDDSKTYVIEGIIEQYILRTYQPQSNRGICGSENIERWLMINNIRCYRCNMLACPFHRDHGGFETLTDGTKSYLCCGWCVDILANIKDDDSYYDSDDAKEVEFYDDRYSSDESSSSECSSSDSDSDEELGTF